MLLTYVEQKYNELVLLLKHKRLHREALELLQK